MNWYWLFWCPIIPLFAGACALPLWQSRRAGRLLVNLGGNRQKRLYFVCLSAGMVLLCLYPALIGRQIRQHRLLIVQWFVPWRKFQRWEWLGLPGDPTLILAWSGDVGGVLTWRVPAKQRPVIDKILCRFLPGQSNLASVRVP